MEEFIIKEIASIALEAILELLRNEIIQSDEYYAKYEYIEKKIEQFVQYKAKKSLISKCSPSCLRKEYDELDG